MEQDTNREYLNKLLDFLQSRILSNPANNWFAKNLYKILAPTSDARISDIHEQCIESILHEQAAEFYKNFVLDKIKPQLISDFIKMEHWRRRNNVQEFCMALYQQIEAITNHLGSDGGLNLIWRSIRNAGFFVDFNYKDIRKRFEGGNSRTIKSCIIYKEENYNKELAELAAMDKFKAILFLIVHNTNIDKNSAPLFNEDFNTGYDIYLIRNLNHRGNTSSSNIADRISYILNSSTYAMCSLLGFYARFISGINKNYPIANNLVELAELCCKQNN